MRPKPIVRPGLLREVRLWSGLVVLAYLVTHLLNHALGLTGVAAMEDAQHVFVYVWQGPAGTTVLYGALGIHFLLALWSVYQRRQWRMSRHEALQLVLGIVIPAFLISHIVDTRIAHHWFRVSGAYTRVLLMDRLHPDAGVAQAILLVLAWGHGVVGLHYWLRLKPWYPAARTWVVVLGILVPVLALIGFYEGLGEIARQAADPGWTERTLAAAGDPQDAVRDRIAPIKGALGGGLALSLALSLAARAIRNGRERRRSVRVSYPGGRVVAAPLGHSVLEISRLGAVPHASVCGGRGRCSTCRVRITIGLDDLPEADSEELAVLRRVGAPADVRLACQLRPWRDLAVTPLLPAGVPAHESGAAPDYLQGDERDICVLFADLRGFTRFSESKLPYDVVFFLNRYFETMGRAIERAGGVANQFTGDGVMALFGLESGPAAGARQALEASRAMAAGIAQMNADLALQLDEPLRIGIGIHAGPAVVGRMGHGVAMYLTAVGDTVHVASRLQDLTKKYDCQLVISDAAAALAGVAVEGLPRHETAVRNRSEPIAVRTVKAVESLPAAPRSRP